MAMNITQTLTPALIVEALNDWESVVRDLWVCRLRSLDMANIWHMPDGAISMFSLVFRAPSNNSHVDTDWFLIDPFNDMIEHHNVQHRMFQAVAPSAGICDMLWLRNGTWYTMATSSYRFNIQRDYVTGRMTNA
jgi:hypothetical protein